LSLQRHVYTLTQTSNQTRQLCISPVEQSTYVTSQRRVFESHRATYVTSNITDLDHNQQRPDQILPATAPANQQLVLSAARSISSSLHFSAFGLQQLVTDSASYDQISARSTKHMLAQRLCFRTRIQTTYSQLHFTQQLYKLTQTGFEFLCPQPATITVTRIFDQRIWIATATRPDQSINCSSHSAARAYSSSPHQQLALASARFQLSAAFIDRRLDQ